MTTFRIDIHDAADPYRFMFSEEIEADSLEEANAEAEALEQAINADLNGGCIEYGEEPGTGRAAYAAYKVMWGTVMPE